MHADVYFQYLCFGKREYDSHGNMPAMLQAIGWESFRDGNRPMRQKYLCFIGLHYELG